MGNKNNKAPICNGPGGVLRCLQSGTSFEITSTLTSLDLKQNNITDDQFAILSTVLATDTTVTSLDLTSNNLTDGSTDSLKEIITKNKTITSLDLSRNQFTDVGATAIATSLSENSNLKSFSIASNSIGKGALDICSALKQNSSLTFLNLGDIAATPQVSTTILETISQFKSLMTLKLYDCNFNEVGVNLLADILKQNVPPLIFLNLYNTRIEDKDAQLLEKALQNNYMLCDINLDGNKVMTETMTNINNVLVKNRGEGNTGEGFSDRQSDITKQPKPLEILVEFEHVPVVSFEKSLEFLNDTVGQLNKFGFLCLHYAEEKKMKHPLLSIDELASINLYTREWHTQSLSLYYILNKCLRNSNTEKLTPFLPYFKLLLTALSKLPKYQGNVWRSVNQDLSTFYKKGEIIYWWSFSSCTRNTDELQTFWNSTERTMFNVQCLSGVNIVECSSSVEEEEVLLIPGTCFQVCNNTKLGKDLHLIELKEINSPWSMYLL